VAEARTQYAAAFKQFDESLTYSRQANDVSAIGRAVSSLGNLARRRGDYAQAIAYLEESLAIARELNIAWAIVNGLTSLGHVACEQADYQRASILYRESLRLCLTMPNEAMVAWLLEGAAVVAAARDDYEQAARLCGMIARLRYASGGTTDDPGWVIYAHAIEAAQSALGTPAWGNAIEAGKALSTEAAISAALEAMA
jgi:tetratricopeptide (TPR) repeat protein